MNTKMIRYILCRMLGVEAVLLMIPVIVAALYQEMSGIAFLIPAGILLLLFFLAGVKKPEQSHIYGKEGMVIVALAWILWSLFGAMPFTISGFIPNYMDAFFETVSGFTTTGASILTDVEAMSKGMLYWRSFTHWLGGMGVMVFLLAVIPASEKGSGFTMHLLRAESPGPNVGKLVPRMRQTATILYMLYIALTMICFVFLLIGDMSPFEAICTAYGTAGTGGFGIKNDSMASYSVYIQNVCTVFMILFGVNFTCYYMLLLGKVKDVLKDEELRLYLGLIFSSVILISINTRSMFHSLGETVQQVFFQVATIITTTGFATTDFDLWPTFSKAILIILMFCGASAGSTGGGFKCGRILLLFKNLQRNLHKTLNPQKVLVVRNNGQVVSEKVLDNLNTYLIAYVMITIVSFLIICLDGKSLTTTMTSVAACFNNIGPGLDGVGPTCNYHNFSVLSKIVLIVDMLAGRLEIFPIMILLSKNTWKKLG